MVNLLINMHSLLTMQPGLRNGSGDWARFTECQAFDLTD